MRSRSIFTSAPVLVALALVVAATSRAFAQDPPPRHQMHQEMHGHPMMMAMMEGPQMALREHEALGLSANQVQRLESVQEQLRNAHHGAMEQMRAVHQELAAATNDRLDEARARAALERMAGLHTEMGLAMLRARQETRAVLSEEQRERFAEIGRAHMQHPRHMMEHEHGMGPGMMAPGMMMMCPMMMQHGRS